MDEPQIFTWLAEIFGPPFDDDLITVTPELSAKDVDDWYITPTFAWIMSVEKASLRSSFSTSEIGKLENVGDLVKLIKARGVSLCLVLGVPVGPLDSLTRSMYCSAWFWEFNNLLEELVLAIYCGGVNRLNLPAAPRIRDGIPLMISLSFELQWLPRAPQDFSARLKSLGNSRRSNRPRNAVAGVTRIGLEPVDKAGQGIS